MSERTLSILVRGVLGMFFFVVAMIEAFKGEFSVATFFLVLSLWYDDAIWKIRQKPAPDGTSAA